MIYDTLSPLFNKFIVQKKTGRAFESASGKGSEMKARGSDNKYQGE